MQTIANINNGLKIMLPLNLHNIGLKYGTDKATVHGYCSFYEQQLPDRSFSGRLLEVGIYEGASLQMWREYYPNAEIVGVDIIDKSHLNFEGITMLKLDATVPAALKPLGRFDIIIDDGSHYTLDQQKTFKQLYYNQLNSGGYYVMEDLHTSFMPIYINSDLNTVDYLDWLKLDTTYWRREPNLLDSITAIIKKGS